jgi:hypothetical protein
MMEQSIINGDINLDVHANPTLADGMVSTSARTILAFDNVQDFIRRYDDNTHTRREKRRTAKAALTPASA